MMNQTLLPNLRSSIVRCSVCSVDVCAVLIGRLRALKVVALVTYVM